MKTFDITFCNFVDFFALLLFLPLVPGLWTSSDSEDTFCLFDELDVDGLISDLDNEDDSYFSIYMRNGSA